MAEFAFLTKAQDQLSEVETVARKFAEASGDLAVNLVVAALIFVITIWASRWLSKLARRMTGRVRRHGPPDATLQSFAGSLTRYVVLTVGFVAVLQQLGVQTTSIIAVLGAASIAIGLALQGALGNVAAGVMILLFRPYRVGDTIKVAGQEGVVRLLDLFVTELATADNVRVIVPNGKVFGDVIINTSAHATRRVDIVFKVDLKRPIDPVLDALREAAAHDARVLKAPEPTIEIVNVSEGWVEAALHVWAKSTDHGALRSDFYLLARRTIEDIAEAKAETNLEPIRKAAAQ
jgi:small conductance mechanosensitive channel